MPNPRPISGCPVADPANRAGFPEHVEQRQLEGEVVRGCRLVDILRMISEAPRHPDAALFADRHVQGDLGEAGQHAAQALGRGLRILRAAGVQRAVTLPTRVADAHAIIGYWRSASLPGAEPLARDTRRAHLGVDGRSCDVGRRRHLPRSTRRACLRQYSAGARARRSAFRVRPGPRARADEQRACLPRAKPTAHTPRARRHARSYPRFESR